MRALFLLISIFPIISCVSQQAASEFLPSNPKNAAVNCNAPTGWSNIEKASAGKIVFFGELHGTVEGPRLVGEYVCEVAKLEGTTIVALELPGYANEALSEGLESSEPEQFWLKSLDRFWDVPPEKQDGRRSRAMLDLLLRIHQLRSVGHNVELYAFGPTSAQAEANAASGGIDWIYESEAENLRQLNQAHDRVIVLAGNVHAMKERISPEFSPTASFLSEDSISINQLANGGTAWNCHEDGECGETQVKASSQYEKFSSTSGDKIRLADEMKPFFDGYLLLGVVSVSPPAILSSEKHE